MIKKIGIKNYKAFRDYNEIEIKPITILIGPNSAGKSTLLKLFSKLKNQNNSILIEKIEPNTSTFLKNKNPIEINIEYGYSNKRFLSRYCFKENKLSVETSHNIGKHNSNKIIENKKTFSLKYLNGSYPVSNWDALMKLARKRLEDNYGEEIKEINNFLKSFKGSYFLEIWDVIKPLHDIIIEDFIKEDQSNITFKGNPFYIEIEDNQEFEIASDILKHCKYDIPDHEQYLLIEKYDQILSKRFNDLEKSIINNNITNTRTNLHNILKNINAISINHEILKNKIIESLCVVIFSAQLQNELFLNKRYYLNKIKKMGFNKLSKYSMPTIITIKPLRGVPKYFYNKRELIETFQIPSYVLEESYYLTTLQKAVNKLLCQLGITYKLLIKEIKHRNLGEKIYVVKLKDVFTGYEYNINELGFGISQVLPIIINIFINNQSTYYRRASIDFEFESKLNYYLIEQPEIHLHPKQQTLLSYIFYRLLIDNKLYDFMADEFEDINDYDKDKLIIETHSEHLIRGFQLLVAQGKILPEHLGIYYINRDKYGASSIKQMEVNNNGLFKEAWPEGFFDQHYKLAKEILFARKSK